MKSKFRSASGVALLIGFAGAFPAWAQTPTTAGVDQITPPAQDDARDAQRDRVVVTGSLIAGSAEDAALPVEVFSQAALEEQGAPTALEFVKSLPSSGPTLGEAYYFAGAGQTGNVGFNLRGIGADKTLTLLNGRRTSENASYIPAAALARTEVLKDGAAVVYGADATGGVVNFITRTDFNGIEARTDYKYIDGSDGEYGVHLLGGWGDGDVNVLLSLEWEHRSRLESEERSFTSLPYDINPAPWSAVTNVARYTPRGAIPIPPASYNTAAARGAQFGSAVATSLPDFTPSQCNAFGGTVTGAAGGVTTTGIGGNSTCNYDYVSYYNLVEEQDLYRAFAQVNAPVNDWMNLHIDATYGQLEVPKVFGSPAQPGTRGPAIETGLASQYYVPTVTTALLANGLPGYAANPYAAEFLARTGYATANPTAFAATQGLTINSFRAFAHGGNPGFNGGQDGFGVPSKVSNQYFRVSTSLNGDLPESLGFLAGIHYDAALTYNDSSVAQTSPDILGFRLQEALAGFGGPNCAAPDLNPSVLGTQNPGAAGKNGCFFFNPFSTSFLNQPELGLANPNSGTSRGLAAPAGTPGWETPAEVVRWLFDDRYTETKNNDLTFDLVFSGETPIPLPGGNVGLAVGYQARALESRQVVPSNYYNGNTPCEWPNTIAGRTAQGAQTPLPTSSPQFNGCTPDEPGPFVFFATNRPDYRDRQASSYFAEAQFPVFDSLNLTAAVRREEFSGGFEATVYKVSGKWDVWGPLSLRASYGTNYQAPGLTVVPGEVANGTVSLTKAAGQWLGSQTITRSDIEPETAKAMNAGVIWQSSGFAQDHDFRLIVDYFKIETEGEIRSLATSNNIAELVFPGANDGTALANCSSPLISRIFLNSTTTSPGGACVQGSTRASDINIVQSEIGNGPGQTTAGFDIQVDYTLPLGEADFSIGAQATKITELTTSAQILDGVTVVGEIDRLGYLNFGNVVSAVAVAGPEWRGNAYANLNWGQHNIRAVINYVSGVTDQRGPITLYPYTGTSPATPVVSRYGVDGQDFRTLDIFYNFKLSDDLRFSASIVNATNEDPPDAREELGYDPLMGSPLGRTVEFSVKKTF